MLFIGDQHGRGEAGPVSDSADGLLQEAIVAEQHQQLFRVERARHRPEPCTRTAGQNDGVYHATSLLPWGRASSTFANALPTYTVFAPPQMLPHLKSCLVLQKKSLMQRSPQLPVTLINGTRV